MSLDFLEFRIIDKHELAQLVPYSQSQIKRLEESGSFRVRVRLVRDALVRGDSEFVYGGWRR